MSPLCYEKPSAQNAKQHCREKVKKKKKRTAGQEWTNNYFICDY